MQIVLNQMTVLFILMAVGFIIGKVKLLTTEGNTVLSKIVLNITLPCTILSSVFENESVITIADTAYFILMSLLAFLIAFLVSVPIVLLMGGDKANRGLLTFISVFSNCGFMGLPVALAIFGASSAYYVALFSIIFNILVFSVGIIMISGKGGKFDPKQLINPTLIIALLAIPIALFNLQFPFIITEVARITGYITIPGAMLVVGSSLAYVPLKTVFSEWRVGPATALKLVAIPIVTWLVLRQIISNELLLGVLVIVSGMPTAATASMLTVGKGNEHIASAGTFLTTVLCGVTVPLIAYLLLM